MKLCKHDERLSVDVTTYQDQAAGRRAFCCTACPRLYTVPYDWAAEVVPAWACLRPPAR